MFWNIAISLGVNVGIWALNKYVLADDPKRVDPETIHIANTQEGVPIPIVYGSVRLEGMLAWYGNIQYLDGSAWGVPYVYGVDMIFQLAVPSYGRYETDARGGNGGVYIRRIWWGDVPVDAMDGTFLSGAGYVSSFGDGYSNFVVTGGGGGSNIPVLGLMQLRAGTVDQDIATDGGLANVVLANAGADLTSVPGFRNQVMLTIACSSVTTSEIPIPMIGANPSPPQISVELCTRIGPNAFRVMPPQENPIDVILDILTGAVWKVGISTADIDTVNFQACASVLSAEGSTYSAAHSSTDNATRIIIDILKQIDAIIFQEPTTGKIKIKLVRADYNPVNIPVVDMTNTVGKPEYTVSSWSETYNQVRVTFPDAAQNYQQGSVVAQSLSVLGMHNGRIRSLELQFQGVTNATLATKLASRELAAASRPLCSSNCTLNQSFYAIRPGDVVSVNWPKYGVASKVMRILSVDLGELASRGVKVTMIEDVFDRGTQYGTVAPPAVTQRVDPLTKRVFVEAPRWLALGLSNLGVEADPDAPRVLSLAAADDTAISYEETTFSPKTVVQSIETIQTYSVDVPKRAFPISFTLVNNYSRIYEPYDTTTGLLVITNVVNVPSVFAFESLTCTDGTLQFLLVTPGGQHEIISFESITNLGGSPTQYRLNNVWRAVLDTVPLDHIAGERGYFVGPAAVGRIPHNLNQTVKGQAVPSRG